MGWASKGCAGSIPLSVNCVKAVAIIAAVSMNFIVCKKWWI